MRCAKNSVHPRQPPIGAHAGRGRTYCVQGPPTGEKHRRCPTTCPEPWPPAQSANHLPVDVTCLCDPASDFVPVFPTPPTRTSPGLPPRHSQALTKMEKALMLHRALWPRARCRNRNRQAPRWRGVSERSPARRRVARWRRQTLGTSRGAPSRGLRVGLAQEALLELRLVEFVAQPLQQERAGGGRDTHIHTNTHTYPPT